MFFTLGNFALECVFTLILLVFVLGDWTVRSAASPVTQTSFNHSTSKFHVKKHERGSFVYTEHYQCALV
jgi:hypothetical protein